MVLEHMVKALNIRTEVVMCPIVREEDGLALSSRNIHLSETDRQKALILSKSLFYVKDNFEELSLEELKSTAWRMLASEKTVTPEYFEICDAKTLLPLESKTANSIVALVAAQVGQTRLIDNIILK
jgi:pantoate--beta-alanine ligase